MTGSSKKESVAQMLILLIKTQFISENQYRLNGLTKNGVDVILIAAQLNSDLNYFKR